MQAGRISKVQSRWLGSYAIVLLIPIIMMAATYFQSRQVIKGEIDKANSALLLQLQQEIDNYIDFANRLTEVVSLNTNVGALIRNQAEVGTEERLSMVRALADFKAYNIAKRYVDHFYLYFHEADYILGDNSHYETAAYYDLYIRPTGLTLEEWKARLTQAQWGSFSNLYETGGGDPGKIVYAQLLPIYQGNSSAATLAVELNEEQLRTSMSNIQTYNEGVIFIVGADGRLLSASGETGELGKVELALWSGGSASGNISTHWGKEEMILSYVQSERTGFTYVYALPSRLYSEKVEYVRNITILTLALAVITGLALSIFMASRNYHPLRRLVRGVAERSKLNPQDLALVNEYAYLEEAIDQTLDSNKRMNQMLERQKKTIRSNSLVRLLKGRVEGSFPLEEALSGYGVRFWSGGIAVLLFYLEDYSGFFRQDEQDEGNKHDLVHLIVTNIVEELAGQEHQGWMTEIDELLACVVNFREGTGQEEALESLKRLAEEAQRFIGSRFHIHLSISVSSVHSAVAKLPAAYQEALEAMEYRMLLGVQSIIWHDSIRHQELAYAYSMEKEQILINYISAGDYHLAKETLDEIIDSNLSQPRISVDMIRCLMFDMCSTMMKAAIEANLERSELYKDNLQALQELMNRTTVSGMRERMTAFLGKVCGHVQERRKSNKSRLKEGTLAFIAEHFRDQTLSVSTISGHLGVHPSYLSRYFKEQTGDTLTDYINRYRLEQAKPLLLQDSILIKDISDSVGFYSISTFIRLFKKYEGLTPSAYRENNKA
ncbi:helix-turn-helix domain-containing protein [Paenibacillus sp. YN15]|uniref:helix-turn-helix domain-containing protein n=1 Tax=Paenibacillus sp. YN15 TaxID=1742774 RepID=UPI0015EC387E|nr:helix-turn-helix domain-containing protein [Paenibacillus sp. YN15]